MNNFFGKEFSGESFVFLGMHHQIALAVLLILAAAMFLWQNPGEREKKMLRYGMAAVLLFNEATWHLWNGVNGIWSVQTMLPLHVCSVLVFLGAVMLITKNYTIYELMYFLGIGGAIQAYLTPDLGIYGFPHVRFFQVFISHGLIILSAIYMTAVEKYRPTPMSMLRVLGILAVYAAVIFPLNLWLGSNYLYIAHKPYDPSLIDMLAPWPYYIPQLAGIALIEFGILYLPFALVDSWRALRRRTGATA